MRLAEVAGLEGVGGEVNGLTRVWKCVEKLKAHAQKTAAGRKALVPCQVQSPN
jgi:hypothetical protein